MRKLDRELTARRAQVSGHFGELIQGRIGPNGPVALISLPCPALTVTATAQAARGLSIHSPNGAPLIQPARARAFLASLGLRMTARVTMRAAMPVGGGAGTSTAALVALARLAGWQERDLADDLTLARACVLAEGASDPLMLHRPAQALWASRQGLILADLHPLPAFDILGGFWGQPQRTAPADLHFPDISALLPDWISAAKLQDLDALARLTTTSASMTLALRGPRNDPTEALSAALGAKGFLIAHTGSARGLIFARGQAPTNGRATLRAAGLSKPLIFRYDWP